MLQLRMTLLYCAAAMSGAFSGLLAAGIAKMRGVGGLNGKLPFQSALSGCMI